LVGVQFPGVTDVEHAADLAELGRLAHTLGLDVVGTVTQKRDSLAAAAVLGEGKLHELAAFTGGSGVVQSGAPERKSKVRARWEAEAARAAGVDHEEDEEEEEAEPAGDDGAAKKATMVIVDHEISPSQARNLERATGASVLDR